jgi:LemA protein
LPLVENPALNRRYTAMLSPTVITLLAVGGVVLLLIFWLVAVYNGLVISRNQYRNAFAQIDVQLKRRYDLIPNLVEAVKGYMAHERETLEAVITARNSAFAASQKAASDPTNPEAITELNRAEGQLAPALSRLLALAEAYPDLKANQNMLALQEELTSTENKIGFARQAYNDAVMQFNNQRSVFPAVMVAGMFGFPEAKMFEVESPAQREAPRVSFK